MAIIVPPSADHETEAVSRARHICPSCGKAAKSIVTRETSTGTINTDCLCPTGHIWSVHWMGAA